MILQIPFPAWLHPEIIPGLPFRWYGLMYIFAFGTAYIIYRRMVRERNFPMNEDQLSGLFFCVIIGLLLGARIFSALVYEPNDIFRRQPWLIFWPFRDGRFTGFQGMSYHGGVIGGLLGMAFFAKTKGYEFREISDMFGASIPLGYTFGRLGNFINGELFGKITSRPWGIYFPGGSISPAHPDYHRIIDITSEMGIEAIAGPGGILNFPRHPSQLYEMFFEGIFLWAIIYLVRNKKPFKGFLTTLYISGYGFVRFFIEYFREPDIHLGYPLSFVPVVYPPALSHPLLAFSTGQILCVLMILLGIVWAFLAARMPNPEPVRIYPDIEEDSGPSPQEKAAERNRRRKNRAKLK
ncbi:MAG: prolipoprotein diacylglyceryl transferase [Treponema sp.]|nr:prolipoprotein diacylglyceryl transferase [Treponema sp.]